MKITIEPTNEIATVRMTPTRIWHGVTDSAIQIRLHVARIESPTRNLLALPDDNTDAFRNLLDGTPIY